MVWSQWKSFLKRQLAFNEVTINDASLNVLTTIVIQGMTNRKLLPGEPISINDVLQYIGDKKGDNYSARIRKTLQRMSSDSKYEHADIRLMIIDHTMLKFRCFGRRSLNVLTEIVKKISTDRLQITDQ